LAIANFYTKELRRFEFVDSMKGTEAYHALSRARVVRGAYAQQRQWLGAPSVSTPMVRTDESWPWPTLV
jgi:hypothetical protein